MTLQERYKGKELSFLINIVEHQQDYTLEAVYVVKQEIVNQGFSQEQVFDEARKMLKKRIWDYLEGFDVVNGKLELIESYYFNEEEVKLYFREVFTEWQQKHKDMIPEGWLYTLGGF